MTTPSAITSTSPCKVLLIDDDSEYLAFWARTLTNRSSNYSVIQASSVQEGLEAFRAQKVDCVILDLDFPDSSGFQFLIDVVPNRDRPEIAIVCLTRLRNPTLREMAVRNGAQAYLVKQSTSADELDKVIQEAIVSVASAVTTH